MSKAPERSAGPRYTLDRITAVPALVGNADDFLVVTGLAGTAKDMAAMTKDGANFYGLAGAMGLAFDPDGAHLYVAGSDDAHGPGAGQHVLGAADGLLADGGQDQTAARTLDHRRLEQALQLLDRRGKRRLADMGGLGGAAERAVFGQQLEVTELSERR